MSDDIIILTPPVRAELRALVEALGSQRQAARAAGVAVTTLREWIGLPRSGEARPSQVARRERVDRLRRAVAAKACALTTILQSRY